MTDKFGTAGAGADCVERATGCRQHRSILVRDGLEVRIHHLTGAKYLEPILTVATPKRQAIEARNGARIEGLRIFHNGHSIKFEWVTKDCVDLPECADIQNRCGWNEYGYGFSGLEVVTLPDGSHRATWSCSVSCD